MYFSNSYREIGEQLEEVSGSSPPSGNINGWRMVIEEGEDKKIGTKSVHSIIKLYPITGHRSKIRVGKNEYVGYDRNRYNIPLTFGLDSSQHLDLDFISGLTEQSLHVNPDFINRDNGRLIEMLGECGVETR